MQIDYSQIYINALSNIPIWIYILLALAIILPIITPKEHKHYKNQSTPLIGLIDTIIDIIKTIIIRTRDTKQTKIEERTIQRRKNHKLEFEEKENILIQNAKNKQGYSGLYKKESTKKEYLSSYAIAKEFNISAKELNQIFKDLKWAEKKDKWWIATILGLKNGAKEAYNPINKQKYIKWDRSIKNNDELISMIKKLKKENISKSKNTNRISNIEKKQKGNKYEEYIATYFRDLEYTVWEHGKEKGMEDSSIDLFIKKDKYVYFVQCKNWDRWKINHKEVKATRTDVRDYLKKNKEFWNLIKDYQMKILYITPKRCLAKSAYKYIEENRNVVEYQVIPIQ